MLQDPPPLSDVGGEGGGVLRHVEMVRTKCQPKSWSGQNANHRKKVTDKMPTLVGILSYHRGWGEGCYDPSPKVGLCFGGQWSNLAYQGLFGPSLSILILAHGGWAARGHHGPSGAGLFSRGRRATQHQLDRLRPSSPPSQKSACEPKYSFTYFVGRKFVSLWQICCVQIWEKTCFMDKLKISLD